MLSRRDMVQHHARGGDITAHFLRISRWHGGVHPADPARCSMQQCLHLQPAAQRPHMQLLRRQQGWQVGAWSGLSTLPIGLGAAAAAGLPQPAAVV